MLIDETLDEGDTASTTVYEVVVNDEEQYSIWPAEQPVPDGWRTIGFAGPKVEALDHIETVWTDITPLSVRRAGAQSTS
ncbi:MAG: MbtH family protein [Nocardioides sp.]|uniref:MbtH family protein n=1 Tax=Nocardioides sp. TaxID=35761 RepID=UPI0023984F2D|nr:MbtH family protein [Nocardioides sp.]MDE0775685.1 MbtH family protein [Nocardioides sp.]